MKTVFLLSLFLFLTASPAISQYYYQDFETSSELEWTMQSFLTEKVSSFQAIGYDQRGVRNTDFQETHRIDANTRTWWKAIRSGQEITRQAFRFDDQGRIQQIADSTGAIVSTTDFSYRADQLAEVRILIADTAGEFNKTEIRQYQYKDGLPASLLRIVNGTDSTRYKLVADEQKRIVEEKLDRSIPSNDFVYYYYNDAGQLSDIVRYDKYLKKLMPERMFEYDAEGRIIQMITMVSNRTGDFLTWRYAFSDKGLKTREALFNRQKQQTGRIDYSYQFMP